MENYSREAIFAKRIPFIRDALLGLIYHLPNPTTFIYPFTDLLLLLFQERMALVFWDFSGGSPSPLFRSFWDPQYRHIEPPLPGNNVVMIPTRDSDIGISAYRFEIKSEKEIQYEPDQVGTAAIRELFHSLKQDDDYFIHLHESIKKWCEFSTKNEIEGSRLPEVVPRAEITITRAWELLEKMKQVIDDACEDLKLSPKLKFPSNEYSGLTNLFAVIRMVLSPKHRFPFHSSAGLFTYTAGYLLSNSQTKYLEGKFDKQEVELFQTVLGERDRSVSDSVFSSGLVAFRDSVSSPLSVAESGVGKSRSRLEETIFTNSSIFYLPIHVGGTPWIGFFTTSKQENTVTSRLDTISMYNYHLYRDLIPRLASQVRAGSRRVFLNLIKQSLREALDAARSNSWSTDDFASDLWKRWQEIEQIYPYPLIFPQPNSELMQYKWAANLNWQAKGLLNLPDDKSIEIAIERRGFLPRQVEYDPLQIDSVLTACHEAVLEHRQRADQIILESNAAASHVLKVPIRILSSIVSDIDADISEKRKIIRLTEDLMEFTEFAGVLIRNTRQEEYLKTMHETFSK